MGRIIVGIDTSEDSRRALALAIDEAVWRASELVLVHAYPTPEIVALPAVVTLPSDAELKAAAEEIIADMLADVVIPEGLSVTTLIAPGGAARVLCEESKNADMLVVGARGLGGFRGLLLGSVTHQVVAHAHCPVLISVPGDR
ncbi:MAG: universal stress protein [Nitriliruptoraceae bacterium]